MVGLVRTTWIGFVKVDAVVINAANQERSTKRTGAAVLGEGLFEIADFLDEDVNRNGCLLYTSPSPRD